MATLRDPFFEPNTVSLDEMEQLQTSGMGSLRRGWESGRIGADRNALGIDAAAARANGELEQAAGLQAQNDALAQRQAMYAPAVQKVEDANSIGSGLDWAAGQVGQGVASMVDPAAAATAVGAVGRVAGMLPGGAGKIGRAIGAFGAPAAAFGINQRQMAGEFVNTAAQDAELMARTSPQELYNTANMVGAAGGALDTVLPGIIGRQLTGGALRQGMKAMGAGMGPLAKTGLGMLGEGTTEIGQGEISRFAQGELNPNRDTSGDWSDRLNEGLGGAVGGSPLIAAGAYADAGYNRAGQAAGFVGDKAGQAADFVGAKTGQVFDMAQEAYDGSALQRGVDTAGEKAKGLFGAGKGKIIDLATDEEGNRSASALVKNLRTKTSEVYDSMEEALNESAILSGTPPEGMDIEGPEFETWFAKNNEERIGLLDKRLTQMAEKGDPKAGELADRIFSSPDTAQQGAAVEEAAQYLQDNSNLNAFLKRAEENSRLGGRIAGAAGSMARKVGGSIVDNAVSMGKAALNGFKEGGKKNMQGAVIVDKDAWQIPPEDKALIDKVWGPEIKYGSPEVKEARERSYVRASIAAELLAIKADQVAERATAHRITVDEEAVTNYLRSVGTDLAILVDEVNTSKEVRAGTLANQAVDNVMDPRRPATKGGAFSIIPDARADNQGKYSALAVKVNRIASEIHQAYGTNANEVIEQLGLNLGDEAGPTMDYLRHEVALLQSKQGVRHTTQMRRQASQELVNNLDPAIKSKLLQQGVNLGSKSGSETLLKMVESVANERTGAGFSKILAEVIGRDNLDKLVSLVTPSTRMREEAEYINDSEILTTDSGLQMNDDGEVVGSAVSANGYEASMAERKVEKSQKAGGKIYGFYGAAGLRTSGRGLDNDPFRPVDRATKAEVAAWDEQAKERRARGESPDYDSDPRQKNLPQLIPLRIEGAANTATKRVQNALKLSQSDKAMADELQGDADQGVGPNISTRRAAAVKRWTERAAAGDADAQAKLDDLRNGMFENRRGGFSTKVVSAAEVMKARGTTEPRMVSLFAGYMTQLAKGAENSQDPSKSQYGFRPAEEMRALSSKARRWLAKDMGADVESTPQERRDVRKAMAEFFENYGMVVAERLGDLDTEMITPNTILDLDRSAKKIVSVNRRYKDNPEKQRQHAIDANILVFRSRLSTEKTATGAEDGDGEGDVFIKVGDLVRLVRERHGMRHSTDFEADSAKSKDKEHFSGTSKNEKFLADLLEGVAMMVGSGFTNGMPAMFAGGDSRIKFGSSNMKRNGNPAVMALGGVPEQIRLVTTNVKGYAYTLGDRPKQSADGDTVGQHSDMFVFARAHRDFPAMVDALHKEMGTTQGASADSDAMVEYRASLELKASVKRGMDKLKALGAEEYNKRLAEAAETGQADAGKQTDAHLVTWAQAKLREARRKPGVMSAQEQSMLQKAVSVVAQAGGKAPAGVKDAPYTKAATYIERLAAAYEKAGIAPRDEERVAQDQQRGKVPFVSDSRTEQEPSGYQRSLQLVGEERSMFLQLTSEHGPGKGREKFINYLRGKVEQEWRDKFAERGTEMLSDYEKRLYARAPNEFIKQAAVDAADARVEEFMENGPTGAMFATFDNMTSSERTVNEDGVQMPGRRANRSSVREHEAKTGKTNKTPIDFTKGQDSQNPVADDYGDQRMTSIAQGFKASAPDAGAKAYPQGRMKDKGVFHGEALIDTLVSDVDKGMEEVKTWMRMGLSPAYGKGKYDLVGGPHLFLPVAIALNPDRQGGYDMVPADHTVVETMRNGIMKTLLTSPMPPASKLMILREMAPSSEVDDWVAPSMNRLLADYVARNPVDDKELQAVIAGSAASSKTRAEIDAASTKAVAAYYRGIEGAKRVETLRKAISQHNLRLGQATPEQVAHTTTWTKTQLSRIEQGLADKTLDFAVREGLQEARERAQKLLAKAQGTQGSQAAPEVAAGAPKAQASPQRGGVQLTAKSPYAGKDQRKADRATKFIGRGSARSSTAQYAKDFGDRANTGSYTAADTVFVSAEGGRPSRVDPDFAEIGKAVKAGATIITDSTADREREYNIGERQVAEFLTKQGYTEVAPGEWGPPVAPRKLNAQTVASGVAADMMSTREVMRTLGFKAAPPQFADVASKLIVSPDTDADTFINQSAEGISHLLMEGASGEQIRKLLGGDYWRPARFKIAAKLMTQGMQRGDALVASYRELVRMALAKELTDRGVATKSFIARMTQLAKDMVSKFRKFTRTEQFEDLVRNNLNNLIARAAGPIDLKANYRKVKFQDAIDADPQSARVLAHMSRLPGTMITGSIVLSANGSVYRDASNMLHDLDMLITTTKDAAEAHLRKAFPDAVQIYDFTTSQGIKVDSFIVPPPGGEVRNIVREGGGERGRLKSYEVVKGGKVIGRTWNDKNGEHKEGSTGTLVDLMQNPHAHAVRTIPFTVDGKPLSIPAPGTDHIFAQKLTMARDKDLLDYLRFVPNSGRKLNAQSSQAPGNASVATDAEIKAAKDEVAKTLGPQFRVDFQDITGYSGEFIEAEDLIVIAKTAAAGAMQTTYHESLHAFFSKFLKGNPDALELMDSLANDPKIMARVTAMLAKYPAAQAQLVDGEERLAYIYQFWRAGMLDLPTKPRKFFQKLRRFFARVLGRISDSERATAILEAFSEGKFANASPSAAGKIITEAALEGTLTTRQLRKMDAAVQKLRSLVMPAHAILTNSDSAEARRLANILWSNPGDEESSTTGTGYLNARYEESARYKNMLGSIIVDLSDRDIKDVAQYLQAKTELADIPYEPHRAAVEKTRALLQRFYRYMKDERGMDIGYRDGSMYFPRVWDQQELVSKADEFKAMLMDKYSHVLKDGASTSQGKLTEEDVAERIYRAVLNRGVTADQLPPARDDGVLSPFFGSKEMRQLAWLDNADIEPFLSKDLVNTLTTYFHGGARAAEYTSRFGEDGKRLESALTKIGEEIDDAAARRFGKGEFSSREASTKWAHRQMQQVHAAVGAIEGTVGNGDFSRAWRNTTAWLTMYQNVRLLPMTLFASVVDPLGMVARGATMTEAFDTLTRALKGVFANWGDMLRGQPKERVADHWEKLALAVGSVDADLFAHHVADEYSSAYMTKGAKRINDFFFRANGMESFNRGMRVGATKSAVQFIQRHAALPEAHSARWLKELGLNKDMLKMDADGQLIIDKHELIAQGMGKAEAEVYISRMYSAINRWVQGAILTPNAAQRPAWSSDPTYSIFFHLKQFSYSFHQTVLKRAVNEMNHGNMAPIAAFAGYIPVMLVSDLVKGLIQGGGELPAHMKGMDLGDHIVRASERAGLLGVGQIGVDASQDMWSLGGPAVEQIMDSFTAPLSQTTLNALPANPLYKNWVN